MQLQFPPTPFSAMTLSNNHIYINIYVYINTFRVLIIEWTTCNVPMAMPMTNKAPLISKEPNPPRLVCNPQVPKGWWHHTSHFWAWRCYYRITNSFGTFMQKHIMSMMNCCSICLWLCWHLCLWLTSHNLPTLLPVHTVIWSDTKAALHPSASANFTFAKW